MPETSGAASKLEGRLELAIGVADAAVKAAALEAVEAFTVWLSSVEVEADALSEMLRESIFAPFSMAASIFCQLELKVCTVAADD